MPSIHLGPMTARPRGSSAGSRMLPHQSLSLIVELYFLNLRRRSFLFFSSSTSSLWMASRCFQLLNLPSRTTTRPIISNRLRAAVNFNMASMATFKVPKVTNEPNVSCNFRIRTMRCISGVIPLARKYYSRLLIICGSSAGFQSRPRMMQVQSATSN